ncbi:MAG: hypothetical protein HYX75_23380 [Acidobacteria bacterium]|nr:hypothetical protein [Acidobacteriota bacterium]
MIKSSRPRVQGDRALIDEPARCHLKRTVCISVLLSAALLAAEGGTYRNEIVRLAQLLGDKDYNSAITGLTALIQHPATPRWLRSSSYFDLGFAHFSSNQIDLGMEAFDKAVQIGFDDFIVVHEQNVFTPHFKTARFQAIYGRMHIAAADAAELFWLKAEIKSMIQDMSMMITENIGRVDDEYTDVPQSVIPTRQTSSVAVLTQREVLAIAQTLQKTMVMQSDISRKGHLMQMGIIRNMPSGREVGSINADAAERLRRVQESIRRAHERAQQRRDAITRRAFVLPAGTSTTPVPCPPLGSVHPPKASGFPAAAKRPFVER